MKRKFKFSDYPIKWQFFWALFSVSIISVVIFGIYTSVKMKEAFQEERYRQMEENLAQASQNIDMMMEKYVNASSLIYMNKEVQNLISMDFSNYNYEDLYIFLKQFIGEIGSVNDEVENFSIYTTNHTVAPDGKLIFRTDEEVISKDWYKKALEGKGQAIFISSERDKNGMCYFYLTRLLDYYRFGDVRNVLKMKINEKFIFRVISETDDKNYMMILDNDNRIVSSKNKEEIGLNAYTVIENYNGKFEDGQRDTARYNGNPMLVSCLSGKWGWKVLYLVSAEEIKKEALQRIQDVIMFAGVCVLISIVLANMISRRMITNRVNILIGAVKRMQKGIFGEEVVLEGKDEIGELAKAFSKMSVKVDVLIKENYQKEIMRKNTELNTLQEQINPHFLYNALSSISLLAIRSGNEQIWHMTQNLAEFYRTSLNKGKNVVTIGGEINLLKSYLAIQQVRFGEALEVAFDVPAELMKYETIKLVLQPIVENAIHHGMRDDGSVLHINISLREKKEALEWSVEDDGVGIEKEKMNELNSQIRHAESGFGMKNVVTRIQMQYGKEYGVKIYSKIEKGTKIIITLPKNKKSEC